MKTQHTNPKDWAVHMGDQGPDTPAQASGNCQTSHPQENIFKPTDGRMKTEAGRKAWEASDAASHSPLPWTVMIADGKPPKIINAGKPGFIATLGFPNEGDREVNAAFIVRACNNFEEMEHLVESARIADKADRRVENGLRTHAQRLADALKAITDDATVTNEPFPSAIIRQSTLGKSREALAQWEKESPADADALEALDQLEQLEGGE